MILTKESLTTVVEFNVKIGWYPINGYLEVLPSIHQNARKLTLFNTHSIPQP